MRRLRPIVGSPYIGPSPWRGGRGECLTPRGNMIAWIRQRDLGSELSPSFMDSGGPRTIFIEGKRILR